LRLLTLKIDVNKILQEQKSWFAAGLIFFSVLLSAPAIFSGYTLDDVFFASPLMVQGPFDHYLFTDNLMKSRFQVWYLYDSELVFRPFRPISSLSLHFDFHYFGSYPIVGHMQSVLWFVLLLLGTFKLFNRILARNTASLAMVIFSLAAYHMLPLGWIAARHAVMGSVFTVWAALCYLLWNQSQNRYQLFSALALFTFGLFVTEFVITVAVFVVSLEMVYSTRRVKQRFYAALPFVVIALIYLMLYKISGHGAAGGLGYHDPFSDTVLFLFFLLPKALTLIGVFTFGIPGLFGFSSDGGLLFVALCGLFATHLLINTMRLCWKRLSASDRRTIKWLTLMGLVAMLPALAGLPDGRAATLSAIAFTGIASILLMQVYTEGFGQSPAGKPARTIAIGLLILAPMMRFAGSPIFIFVGLSVDNLVAGASIDCNKDEDILSLNGSRNLTWIPPKITTERGFFYRNWYQLAGTTDRLTVARTSPDMLEIDGDGKSIQGMLNGRESPVPEHLTVGSHVSIGDLQVEVKAVTNAKPTRVVFKHPDLATDSVCLLVHRSFDLRSIAIPALGEVISIDAQ